MNTSEIQLTFDDVKRRLAASRRADGRLYSLSGVVDELISGTKPGVSLSAQPQAAEGNLQWAVDDARKKVGGGLILKAKTYGKNVGVTWNRASKMERLAMISGLVSMCLGILHAFAGPAQFYVLMQMGSTAFVFVAVCSVCFAFCQRYGERTRELLFAKGRHERELKVQEAAMLGVERFHAVELRKRVQDGLRRRLVLARSFHEANHIARDLMFEHADAPLALQVDRAVGTLVQICDSLENVFFELFDRQIVFRVSIKALVSDEEVVVVARNQAAIRAGGVVSDRDRRDRLEHNSAYLALLSCKKTIFACDDLAGCVGYQNSSANWRENYNATMVVPIRCSRLQSEERFEIAGFIGVDCAPPRGNTQIFCNADGPDEVLQNVLLGFADISYGILKRGKMANPSGALCFDADAKNYPFIMALHENFIAGDWKLPGRRLPDLVPSEWSLCEVV